MHWGPITRLLSLHQQFPMQKKKDKISFQDSLWHTLVRTHPMQKEHSPWLFSHTHLFPVLTQFIVHVLSWTAGNWIQKEYFFIQFRRSETPFASPK